MVEKNNGLQLDTVWWWAVPSSSRFHITDYGTST